MLLIFAFSAAFPPGSQKGAFSAVRGRIRRSTKNESASVSLLINVPSRSTHKGREFGRAWDCVCVDRKSLRYWTLLSVYFGRLRQRKARWRAVLTCFFRRDVDAGLCIQCINWCKRGGSIPISQIFEGFPGNISGRWFVGINTASAPC